ncbi:hypothetical protein Leryth_012494 [Lithospermum erythrorhizon]|nr:hypothetical protein Leryth_012494 [Lithospermum erythrorhizon]
MKYQNFFWSTSIQLLGLTSLKRGRGSLLFSSCWPAVRIIDLLPVRACNMDSPVQTQMAVGIFKSPLSGEYHSNQRIDGKPVGRRRVFVQTETGCVLGMELDRNDNAHTVKEDCSQIFQLMKGEIRAKKDRSGPIEIIGHSSRLSNIKQLINDIVKGMKMGIDPLPVHGGLGGGYYFRNSCGQNVAIVKPTDEEPFAPNNPKGFVGKALGQPGLKGSVRVGETGFREVAAYLLDYDQFANVPPTALVKVTHSIFNVNDGVNGNKLQRKRSVSKIASFQQFVPHDFDASDHGTSSFPVSSVHRIGILDIRILNTDRHAGNLLVRKLNENGRFGQVELIPIDHGLCLPESLEDPYFEWIHWPQASIPFSVDELEYIKKLDPFGDSEMLRSELPMIREACLRVLVLCTIFLKEAAVYGLCLAEIGEMMTRGFHSGEEEPSELELACIKAQSMIVEKEVWQRPLIKTHHSDEAWEVGTESLTNVSSPEKTSVLKLSTSLKNISLGEKKHNLSNFTGTKPGNDYLGNSSSGHRSANEQLPVSGSFVKLVDMNEDTWSSFLEKFQELLYPAFAKRKSITCDQKQIQKLGTSCQF